MGTHGIDCERGAEGPLCKKAAMRRFRERGSAQKGANWLEARKIKLLTMRKQMLGVP